MIRRFRITPTPKIRFRGAGDGSLTIEYDDASAADVCALLVQIGEAIAAQPVAAPTAPLPSQVIGDSPLTIKPPVVAMGQAGMIGFPGGMGGPISQPGIAPPPPPHGMAGLPGQTSNAAPVPGAPVLPQPAVSAPPPPPQMVPGQLVAGAQIGVVLGNVGVMTQTRPSAGKIRMPAAASVQTHDFKAGDTNGIEIEFLKDAQGNVLRDEKGHPMTQGKVTGPVRVLPQPDILPPPPPPGAPPSNLVDASGTPLVSSAG